MLVGKSLERSRRQSLPVSLVFELVRSTAVRSKESHLAAHHQATCLLATSRCLLAPCAPKKSLLAVVNSLK